MSGRGGGPVRGRAGRTWALARHAALTNLRSRPSRAGGAAFLLIAILGQVFIQPDPTTTGGGDRLFGYAFLVGALLALRSGLADHRRCGLGEYLRQNFVTPVEQAAAHATALAAQLLLYTGATFIAGVVVSAGDVRFAAWYTAVLGLGTALFLPIVFLVETVSDFRLPFVAVPILLVVAMAIVEPFRGGSWLLEVLGLHVTPFEVDTLLPLLLRVAIAAPAGLALVAILHAASHRRPWTRAAPPP